MLTHLQRTLAQGLLLLLAGCEGASVKLPSVAFGNLELPRVSRLLSTGVSRLQPGDELVVESALTGERCHLRKFADAAAYEDFTILCEGWARPVGRLRRAPVSADAALLERLLAEPQFSLVAPGAADCGPVEALSETPLARARKCTASDGWPMLYAASAGMIEGTPAVYVAFGPPHLAPVFAAAATEGGERLRAGGESPLVRYARLQAEAAGDVVGLDEIAEYRELVELARLYNQAGEFADAVHAYERALVIQRRGQGGSSVFTASTLAALGLNYASDGRLEDAARAFAAAEPYLERIAWSNQYPRILSYRAAYARLRGDPDAAMADADEAIARWVALLGPHAPPVAHARLVMAGIALATGDITSARAQAREAQQIYERQRERVGAAFALWRLALIEERVGDPARALKSANAAGELMRTLFGDGRNVAEVEFLRGRLATRLGDQATARQAFSEAARLVGYGRYGERTLAPQDLEAWLELLIGAASGGTPAEAAAQDMVRAVQLVRMPVFDIALRRMAVRVAAADPDLGRAVADLESLRQKEAALQLALGRLQLNDAYAPPAEEEEGLRAGLADVRRHRAALEGELLARFPSYGGLITPRPASLASIRRLLRHDEALLRILTTENATWTLLVRGDGLVRLLRSAVGREQLAREIQQLRMALTFEHGIVPYDTQRAWALFRSLFSDLPPELGGIGHLIVVADGPLTSLPLAVLPVEPPAGAGYHNVAWLGTRHAISVLPSVAAFELLRARTAPARATLAFLGVADPVLGGEGPMRGAVAQALAACLQDGLFEPAVLRAMPSLPETADESRQVAAAIGGRSQLLHGSRASEATLRNMPLDRYRVIAFATHGLLPGELPCRNEPGLVLTPPASASGEDDGFLTAGEVATLRLDAEWVVLSACNTAGPDGSLGGGALSGLATGFAYAGARALLVSHWDVLSEPNVTLIAETFRRHTADPAQGKARALLAARRLLASDPERAHPAIWAAFELVGDGGAPAVAN